MKSLKRLGIITIAIVFVLTLSILFQYGIGTCCKEAVAVLDAQALFQSMQQPIEDNIETKEIVENLASSLTLKYNYNTTNYKDNCQIEKSSINDVVCHGEQIYSYENNSFNSGNIYENYTYSSTFSACKNISEIIYNDGNIVNSLFAENSISYDYGQDYISISIENGNTYKYIYDNDGNLISKSKNDVIQKTYFYENGKLFKELDNATGYAYEVVLNNGVAQSYKQFLYLNNKFFGMTATTYGDIPASVNSGIVYAKTYEYGGKNYIKEKTIGNKKYVYDYINDVIVKENIINNTNSYAVDYIFDSSLNRIGFIYNSVKYYYIYDVCGNVVEVLNENGVSVLEYSYDILGKASVTGSDIELAYINSFAFRAKDNWYFDYSRQQYYIGSDIIFNSQYAKNVGETSIPFQFLNNPNKYTVWGTSCETITPCLQQLSFTDLGYEKLILNQMGNLVKKQSMSAIQSLIAFDMDTDKISQRYDLYVIDNQYGNFNGTVYELINAAYEDKSVLQSNFTSRIDNDKDYVFDGENSYIPTRAEVALSGHFIESGKYIKYQSDPINPSIVMYEVLDNTSENYDYDLGNLYNYDTESYILFFGSISADEDMIRVGNLGDVIDYDKISADIEAEINASVENSYSVEEIRVFYVSPEYIRALYQTQHPNLYLGGMSIDDMIKDFGDDWSFTMYRGELIHSSQVPQDVKDDEGFNWGNFFKKIAIGVGCIIVAAVVSVATMGTATVACIAATAATMTAVAAVGGVIGGIVKGVETNSWEGFGEGFADGFEVAAITTSIYQVGGALLGTPPIASCFVAGTPVATELGKVSIEDIKVGDKVKSYNFQTHKVEYNKVVNTFVRTVDQLYYIYTDNGIIHTTSEHPFYVKNYGWKTASKLKAEDILITANGEVGIKDINIVLKTEPVNVYNFEVENTHNYYVGDNQILVHNTCGLQVANDAVNSSSISSGLLFGAGASIGAAGLILGGVLGGSIIESGNISLPNSYYFDSKDTRKVALSAGIVLSMPLIEDRVYEFAYLLHGSNELHRQGPKFNYLEALTIAYYLAPANVASHIIANIKELVLLTKDMEDIINFIRAKIEAKQMDEQCFGFYTASEEAAAKLAFSTGAVVKAKECHGSMQYFHFHSVKHAFHIWYGQPVDYNL